MDTHQTEKLRQHVEDAKLFSCKQNHLLVIAMVLCSTPEIETAAQSRGPLTSGSESPGPRLSLCFQPGAGS